MGRTPSLAGPAGLRFLVRSTCPDGRAVNFTVRCTDSRSRTWTSGFSAVVGAARLYYRRNPALRAKIDALLRELHREFGLKSRFYSAVGGAYVRWKIHREEQRLARGWTYEPATFYEQNEAAQRLAEPGG